MNVLDRRTPTLAPAVLVAAGVTVALYAVLRPYADESTPAGVAAVASGAWVVSHLLAVAALVLLPVGLAAAGLRAAGFLAAAGAGLVPYYGVETFGLKAVAARTLADGGTAMPALTDAIRFGAVQSVTFAAGLGLLAAAGIVAAVALQRRGGGWAGWGAGSRAPAVPAAVLRAAGRADRSRRARPYRLRAGGARRLSAGAPPVTRRAYVHSRAEPVLARRRPQLKWTYS